MRVWISATVVLLLFAGGGGGAVLVTDRSDFCGSCHSMVDIHASWAASPHARVPGGTKPAGCVDCHVAPGWAGHAAAKINGLQEVLIEFTHATPVTRVAAPHYLFPSRCMACHPDVVERDRREGKPRPGRLAEVGLNFPHDLHLAMAEFGPDAAARLRVLEERGEAVEPADRRERDLLQRARKADCATCHGPAPIPGAAPALAPAKPIDPATPFRAENPMNCVFCHRGLGHAVDPPQGFSIPPVANCAQCHTGQYHGTLGVVFEARCYGGEDETSCLKCHPGIPRKLLRRLPLEKR